MPEAVGTGIRENRIRGGHYALSAGPNRTNVPGQPRGPRDRNENEQQ
jgi:hypothetical protein